MSRDPFKPLLADEQKFVFYYLREGGTEEKVNLVERKCRMKPGTGRKMLLRKHVQEEIARRKALVEYEEHKLIARDKARLAAEEDERHKVTLDKIERNLDEVLGLSAETHASAKLAAIQLALVYTGTIRTGRTERVKPIDPTQDNGEVSSGDSFYRSVFDNLRAGEQASNEPVPLATAPAPLLPEEDDNRKVDKPIARQFPHVAPSPKPTSPPAKAQGRTKIPDGIEIT